MYVKRNIRWSVIFRFAWKNLVIFTLWTSFVTFLFLYCEDKSINIGIPFLPLSTIGIAVAFYIGFKNNQSYDRFWEGRKIWGQIVNSSRSFATKVLAYTKDSPEEQVAAKRIIWRQLAWINALRIQLRSTTIFDRKNISYVPNFGLKNDRECNDCIAFFLQGDEYDRVIDKANAATQLLKIQAKRIKKLKTEGIISDFEQISLMKEIEIFYDQQGKCERIKKHSFSQTVRLF